MDGVHATGELELESICPLMALNFNVDVPLAFRTTQRHCTAGMGRHHGRVLGKSCGGILLVVSTFIS